MPGHLVDTAEEAPLPPPTPALQREPLEPCASAHDDQEFALTGATPAESDAAAPATPAAATAGHDDDSELLSAMLDKYDPKRRTADDDDDEDDLDDAGAADDDSPDLASFRSLLRLFRQLRRAKPPPLLLTPPPQQSASQTEDPPPADPESRALTADSERRMRIQLLDATPRRLRLSTEIGSILERRLAGAAVYGAGDADEADCGRLARAVTADVLNAVGRVAFDAFGAAPRQKAVVLLTLGSVARHCRPGGLALETRAAAACGDGKGNGDAVRVFHYRSESFFAVLVCHLFDWAPPAVAPGGDWRATVVDDGSDAQLWDSGYDSYTMD